MRHGVNASKALEILSRALRLMAIVGVIWFTLAAAWGMFGTVGGGHYAAAFGCALSAENMIKWKIIAPVWDYVTVHPAIANYYCHHPFGCFWVYLPLLLVFGHHDWVIYLAPLIMSGLTATLIYRLAQNAWGALGAAAATAGFVMLPITLAFSNFNSLEVTVIFGWALFLWGQSRLLTTWKTRYVVASAFGAGFAACGDWVGYIAVGLVLGWTMLRFMLPERWYPAIKTKPYARWWILTCAVTCACFFFWLAAFVKWNAIDDILGSANSRSSGAANTPLADALRARAYRIDVCFTSLAITLGKLAVPVAVIRVLARRRDEEFFSLAILVAATVQYVGFKQGADVHVFWPHYFGLYFAFAFAQIVLSVRWIVERIASAIRGGMHPFASRWQVDPTSRAIGLAFGLALVCAFVVAIAPDAWRGLREGRATWGRYNQETIRSGADEVRVLEMIASRLPAGSYVDAHSSAEWSWHTSWALHGMHVDNAPLPTRGAKGDVSLHPFFIARVSSLTGADLEALAKGYRLEFYGDVLLIDKRTPAAPLEAFTFQEREPNLLERFFVSGTEPMVHLAHDPFATWEWRTHLGQPAVAPTSEPRTLAELRIAHNIAVLAGDATKVRQLREKIASQLSFAERAEYTQGLYLIGVRHIEGVFPRVEPWFVSAAGLQNESKFNVIGEMEGPARWSFVPPDTLVRNLTAPMPIPTKLWRPGFLYSLQVPLYHRTGVETFSGAWGSRDGAPAPARTVLPINVDLATVR